MTLLLLLACTGPAATDDTGTSADTSMCWDDLAVGDAVTLATGFADGSEGISFVDGHLLVGFPTGVAEVAADGTVTTLTTLDHSLGLAPAEGGALVADQGEFTFDGSGDDGQLLYVRLTPGDAISVASGMPNPNFVTTTPWGEVLVSDDTGEFIYAVDYAGGTGAVRTWLAGVPSPNGMAFSPDASLLYVATTFAPDPPLWRIPVTADGTPGTPEAFATLPTGVAPDGLAIGADGTVWVAANLAGEIDAVDPDTGAITTVGTGLINPASMAFGAGDFDPCSIYYTELYGQSVGRLAVGGPGLPVAKASEPQE